MFETVQRDKIIMGSSKSFGYVFTVVFLILSIYPYFVRGHVNFYFLFISIIIFLLSLIYPNIFKYPNIAWFWFGILLSKILNPLILLFLYFFVVTPIGLFMKLLYFYKGNNYYRINKKQNTYWIERKTSVNDFKDQF